MRFRTKFSGYYVRARSAFLAPLNQAQARLSELRLQQREGLGDLLSLDNAIEASEREVQPFVRRYELDGPDGAGPLPLACAFEIVDLALAQSTVRAANAERDIARANAVLLLGAAFDGHPATAALADAGVLPVTGIPGKGPCAGIGLADGLTRGAALVADARHAPAIATKNEAMRGLLHSAGWQWAGWMLAGFGMLQLSRRSVAPAIGVPEPLALTVPVNVAFEAARYGPTTGPPPGAPTGTTGSVDVSFSERASLTRPLATPPSGSAFRASRPTITPGVAEGSTASS